jgi:ABC-2 type transport system ATP-binding protein
MRSVVRERADAGTTVFFSSHILGEVEAVCDRVGAMNGGRLTALDTIEGLRENAGGRGTITLECANPPAVDGVGDIAGEAPETPGTGSGSGTGAESGSPETPNEGAST